MRALLCIFGVAAVRMSLDAKSLLPLCICLGVGAGMSLAWLAGHKNVRGAK